MIATGASASFAFTVSPTGATTFPTDVNLSVSGLPTGASYSFTPVKLAAGTSASAVTLTVTATKQTAMLHPGESFAPLALALMLLPFSRRMRLRAGKLGRLMNLLLLLIASGAGLVGLAGCGASAPAPQSYTITVTGTSGTLARSTTVALTVQ